MRRLLCLLMLSLGSIQGALAEPATDRVSDYLAQKFGLAKEKRRTDIQRGAGGVGEVRAASGAAAGDHLDRVAFQGKSDG